jgi:hypothetical protein
LPTKAHFSSNGTSRVWGGKSHEFVVDVLGVLAGDHGQAHHGILVDPHEATGLADATILVKMVQYGHGLVFGKFATVQRGPLAFGEAVLARAAGQDAGGLVGSVAEANPEVIQAPAAVVGALGVLAAEGFQVVHSSFNRPRGRKKWPRSCRYPIKQL